MRRVLIRGGQSAGLLVIFAGALASGVVMHANTPAVRRLVATVANSVTGNLFQGKIAVRDVQSLSIGKTGTVRIGEVVITDPENKPVIVAKNVEASIDLLGLTKPGPLVELAIARIGEADVTLDNGPDGSLAIARTFQKKNSAPAKAPAKPGATPAASPVVHLRSASIGKTRLHGNVVPPALDGEIGGLEGRFDLENDVAKVTLDRAHVRLDKPGAPNQRAPITGDAQGEFAIALATKRIDAKASLHGGCGDVPVTAEAEIHDNVLTAKLDIPEVEPARIATAFADVPLTKPVSLHAEAQGRLPSLTVDARARIGNADITAKAELDIGPSKAFKVDVDATHLDADAVGAGMTTDISAKAHAAGTVARGQDVTFAVTTTEGSVGPEKIPATKVEGHVTDKQVTAVLRTSEAGVEASGKVVLDVPKKVATFDLQARSYALQKLARAPGAASGAASARVQGKVDLDKKTINATADVSGENIAASGFASKRINAHGVMTGPLAAPVLDVGFAGVDVQMKAAGKAPLSYPSANGHAKVAFVPAPRVMDASINVAHPKGTGEGITASAEGIHVANGVVEAQGLRVTGLGEPLELDARVGADTWSIRAKSPRVDLHRAAGITGIKELELLPEGTNASVDVDVRQGPAGADGHFDIVVRSDKGFGAGPITAEAHGKIEGGKPDLREGVPRANLRTVKVSATAKFNAEGFGNVEVTSAELDIPGRLDAKSLKRATGVIELRGAVDLSQGAALFAGESVERVAGIASFEARVERGDRDGLPAVRGTVRTDGLEVVFAEPRENAPSLKIVGVDLQAHAAWDGRTEDAELSLLAWDHHGLLGSAGTKSRVPIVAWATGASKLGREALEKLDIDVVAHVPARDLASLPSFFADLTKGTTNALDGQIGGTVSVGGTLGHPRAVVSANVHDLHAKTHEQHDFEPLDGALEGRWDGEQAVMTFAVDEQQRHRGRRKKSTPGRLRGLAIISDVRMRDLLHGRALTELPWRASGELEVENLKLAALPQSNLTGVLSGRARIKDLNGDANFEVKGHIDDFGSGGAKVQSVDIAAGGRDASLYVHGSIVDKTAGDPSQVTLQLASSSLRMKGLEFGWDAAKATRLDYIVQSGRLGLIGPLVKSVASELDGRVDGTGSITLEGSTQAFEGGLAVHDATLYANAIGEEITGLKATARFDRSGTFRIDDASGKLASGEFRASASGQMKGFQFMSADATIVATKGVPISAEGATFAEATGEVKIGAKVSDDRKSLNVTVELPRADIQLPDRDTQMLQPLDPDPTISVGVSRKDKDGKFVFDTTAVRASRGGAQKTKTNEKDGMTTRMGVTLGDEVRLAGRGLDITLGGRTIVDLAEEVKVTGQIDLRGGSAIVQGRRFHVDRGTISFFDGADPADPMVVAAAYWDSPDRTRVWVEFAGPLKSGKLTLRSEPAYSKSEILSVLIFGRPDPNMAAPGAQKSSGAGNAAMGGGLIAGDLNRLLAGLDENLDVETDTMSGNRARAKVGRSFFDRRLKVQVGYAPGQTYLVPDTRFLFLTWLFVPKWSLLVTQGDKGTSILDVLFQHRY
jgi:autotransporter translocation and assembly factor TamB